MLLLILLMSALMLQYFAAYFSSWRTFWLTTLVLLASALILPEPLIWLKLVLDLSVFSVCWSIGCWSAIEYFTCQRYATAEVTHWMMLKHIVKARCLAPFAALKELARDIWRMPSNCLAALRRRARKPSAMIDGRRIPVTILAT